MMFNWIARWLDLSPATGTPGARRAPATGASAGVALVDDLPSIDLPLLFYRLLAGPTPTTILPPAEKLILDELTRLADTPQAGADLVPRVPEVVPQLLRSLRDDSISNAEFSHQLAQDLVLVAEVIREANSSYYRPSRPINTIEGAVMLLGQNGIRMLLARVAFRPIIGNQTGRFARLAAPTVWRQSEMCAQAAGMLAPSMHANAFESYLAGLLHHVGLIVAFRLIDQVCTGDALPASDQFVTELLANARLMSSRIAVLWGFPDAVSSAIANAGKPYAAPTAHVLESADRVATLRLLVDAGRLGRRDPAVEALDPAAMECFEKLSSEDD
jgi:HD-like signal output (HDOD) protein